jgi:uncharacterized protein (TIGR03435 family)
MRWIAIVAVLTVAAAQTSPTFEVASIHPNQSGSTDSVVNFPETGRLIITNATLKTLIRGAWGIQNDQISGGPKWLDTDRYDMEAKTSRPITPSDEQPLLQNLLADRFRLKTHREQREQPVYELTIARSGLIAANTGAPTSIHTNRGPGKTRIAVTGIGLDQFAGMLGKQLGRTVINKTGLHGDYDFALEWDPDQLPDSQTPSVFTALQEQLGLRLDSQKATVPVLVIDSAEHASDN